MTRAVHAFVSGRVQGVGFRWSVRALAERQGLAGWVRNRRDGRVELVFEGPDEAVADALRWLEGPDAPGRVEHVVTGEVAVEDRAGFDTHATT